ncbi:MAG: hypothetical protein K5987_08795 [Lachnospiraceae bacterium]|nr:hypothetical protein [Lachnospiraceae bacterium]
MVDVDQIMYDMIRKSGSVETESVNEIEEIVDTGLDKTDDNVQKMAMDYLTEKGYAKSPQNLDQAKQHIMESSEGSETVRVRVRRRMVEDLLSDMEEADLSKLMNACLLDNLIKTNQKLDSFSAKRYEYAVEVVDDIQLDSEKPSGSLIEFVSFQTLLNRYAAAGFRVAGFTTREIGNHGKLMMSGFSSVQKQTVVIFERQVTI